MWRDHHQERFVPFITRLSVFCLVDCAEIFCAPVKPQTITIWNWRAHVISNPCDAEVGISLGNWVSCWYSGPWFNIKMLSYQYRKSHCGDKTILRPSYLHNGISYTGKMSSLYWIRALDPSLTHLPPNAAYMRQGTGSILVQEMAWRRPWKCFWKCRCMSGSLTITYIKKSVICKAVAILSLPQCVKLWSVRIIFMLEHSYNFVLQ